MYRNLCRLCAQQNVDDKALKLFEGSQRKLLIQLQCVTGVMLRNSSGMPQLICSSCTKSLKDAYLFRENVLRVQTKLKAKLVGNDQDEKPQAKAVEATEFVQVCYSADGNYQITQSINNGFAEDEINIKSSQSSIIKEEDYASEINALYISASDEEQIIERQDNAHTYDYNEKNYISEDSSEFDKKDEICIINVKGNDQNVMPKYTTDETSSPKIKPPKNQKGVNEHSKIFICDQCGNHFTCRNNFQLHLRRHTGDRQCACELCPKKFFTSSELRRHMRKHTGERPFQCKFCERRFTDYSTRIKHERTHTNERPFVCAQCNKSFTTSYILKNHMLTHTGERHFRCDVCDKAFMRRTHLVVHFRSLSHKQAVEKEKLPNLTTDAQVKEETQPYFISGV